MTNLERFKEQTIKDLQRMTAEELAKEQSLTTPCLMCGLYGECKAHYKKFDKASKSYAECVETFRQWLESEVKENGEESEVEENG